MRLLWTGTFGCHGTGGSLRSRGYNVKINMEGEMNMLLCLYNLLTGSLVSVLRVQVLFWNRYGLLLRRRCALYSVCLNYEIPFKPGVPNLFYSEAHLFVFVTGRGPTDTPVILANLYSIIINKRLLCVTKSNISTCYRWEPRN